MKLSNMIKTFWIFFICVELVASQPNWGSQPFDNLGNQPQNVDLSQQGCQNSLPNYLAQPGNGIQNVDNAFAPNWPLKTDPRVNQFSQPPGVFPQSNDLNLPNQAFQQQQVSLILPQYEKYVSPLVRPTAPEQCDKPNNVQVLQENREWLVQNYPNLQDTLVRVQAPLFQTSKYSAVATATATAGSSSGSTGAVATATAGGTMPPQPISPAIDKDITEAHNAVAYMQIVDTNILNTWQLVIEAAKEAANAKAKELSDANCKSTSSFNSQLNYLNKIHEDAENESNSAYSIFAEIKDQVDDLVEKVKDKSYTSTSSKPRNPCPSATATEMPPLTTVPKTIPPAIAKAICDANDAMLINRNLAKKLYNEFHLVIDAAKEVAKADNDCKSASSSNPKINNLNKICQEAEDNTKLGYEVYAGLQDKINYLVDKVKCYLNEQPSNHDQPDTENDNQDYINDAHNAVAYMHKTSTNVLNTWQLVIEAAKEAAYAKAKNLSDADCKSKSSYNSELNYLSKIQKDAQNESKNAYSTFEEVKCEVDDLVKKVKDKSYTSTPSKPRSPLKEGTVPPPTTVPKIIPPAIAKAICDANDAVLKTRNIAEKVYNTLHLVVDAAKEVAKANDNCKSTSSSNPALNNLNKIYKEAEDYIKPGFDAFAEVQDKVNCLIEKVKCYLNEEPSNNDQPDTENDNQNSINDAHNAVAYMHKTSTNVLNTWQLVIEAAKEAAYAKAKNLSDADCKSKSSYNSELNYLSKIQKDAQNESKNAYSTFEEVKCEVDDLVKKVKDKSYTSTPSKPRSPLKEGTVPPPTTVPKIIPPAIAKAICDANDTVLKTRNIAEKVYKTLHLVVDAAKEVAKANDDCKSTSSSNPALNNLNKTYKEAEDYIKPGFDAFAEVQDKVNCLIEKVKCYLNEEPSNNDQPDTENDNQESALEEDEEPTYSEDDNCEDE